MLLLLSLTTNKLLWYQCLKIL